MDSSEKERQEMKHLNPAQSEPTVSVVIPAYNVTKTLPRLLDCLLNQTW